MRKPDVWNVNDFKQRFCLKLLPTFVATKLLQGKMLVCFLASISARSYLNFLNLQFELASHSIFAPTGLQTATNYEITEGIVYKASSLGWEACRKIYKSYHNQTYSLDTELQLYQNRPHDFSAFKVGTTDDRYVVVGGVPEELDNRYEICYVALTMHQQSYHSKASSNASWHRFWISCGRCNGQKNAQTFHLLKVSQKSGKF